MATNIYAKMCEACNDDQDDFCNNRCDREWHHEVVYFDNYLCEGFLKRISCKDTGSCPYDIEAKYYGIITTEGGKLGFGSCRDCAGHDCYNCGNFDDERYDICRDCGNHYRF